MTQKAIAILVLATAGSGSVIFAQTTGTGMVASGAVMAQAPNALGMGMGRLVTGKPYSAQQEIETIQTLADGTRITSGAQKVTYYRDSLGRTRAERMPAQIPGFTGEGSKPPVFIEINDPVAGYRYMLDSNSHTAHRSSFGPNPIAKGNASVLTVAPTLLPANTSGQVFASSTKVPSATPARIRPEVSNEQLGTQTIEGVLATGTRTTMTYPIGFFGNDRPITTVRETWTSRDIGMVVLSRESDPRRGETTTKLTNISLSEPDSSMFQPPAGYEIEDPAVQK